MPVELKADNSSRPEQTLVNYIIFCPRSYGLVVRAIASGLRWAWVQSQRLNKQYVAKTLIHP